MASIGSYGQKEFLAKYETADSLIRANNYYEGYKILKEIEPKINKKADLYRKMIWQFVVSTTKLESQNRMQEQWDSSLKYGLEALEYIKKGIPMFDKDFAAREFWMNKNIIVSYFGLGKLDLAQKHKDFLYKAYKTKKLPDGIDEYFNYSFFKWKDRNIWCYEWFPALPSDRFSTSFTKVVVYVYSTNPDGSDKDQLFRFHVLMFHHDSKGAKFDYILERQMEADGATISGSYYSYVYQEKIDYVKLKKDVLEILDNDIKPNSKRITPKR